MKRKSILLVTLLALATTFFVGVDNSKAEGVMAIGSKIDNFEMPDPKGTQLSYKELKGKNGTLVVFLSIQCPVVKMYDERINKIAEAYKSKGINFIGIYSNRAESSEKVAPYAKNKYKFPVMMDKGNKFADQLGATRTPEVYYFDENDVHSYHGAIDNDRSGDNITKTFLKNAFDEKLAGEEISQNNTKAFGCSIKRVKKDSAE